jgi:3-oxoacyl-[acyl-carrier protein] reductase
MLAREGARVVIADILKEEGAKTIAEISAIGGEGRFHHLDVTDACGVKKLFDQIVKEWGRLDILINNAGNRTHPAWCDQVSDRDWSSVISTHVHGSFYCLREAAGVMKKAGYGRIVNFSSVAAVHGFSTQMNYAAAKFAIVGMTLTAAKELGPHGITVNALQPGVIRSDMTAILLQQGEQVYSDRTPVRRVGETSDVANAVRFLASPESGFINGVVLKVDGGFSLVLSPENDLDSFANAYPAFLQQAAEGGRP